MNDLTTNVRKAIPPITAIYKILMQSAVLRNQFGKADISNTQWREIESLVALGEESVEGNYDVYDLYTYIRAMLAFVHVLTTEIKPAMDRELSLPRHQVSPENRMAVQMTVSNLDNNVRMLLDRLSDLYITVSRLDENQHGPQGALRNEFPDMADPNTWIVE